MKSYEQLLQASLNTLLSNRERNRLVMGRDEYGRYQEDIHRAKYELEQIKAEKNIPENAVWDIVGAKMCLGWKV